MILNVLAVILVGIFILNGVKITKMFDALTKSIVNITKTALVWIIGIIVTIVGYNDPQFRFESLDLNVNLVKGIGFCVIISGNLIYN